MKRVLSRIFFLLFFCLMILFPNISVSGAKTGLILWFQSIIPTLLPFMIISQLIVSLDMIPFFSILLSPISKYLLRISDHGAYAMVTGLLCGYPMGAKTCADLIHHKKISVPEGQYLLCFVNNPSPAFVISFILHTVLNDTAKSAPFLAAVYLAPVLAAFFIRPFFPKLKKEGNEPSFSPYLPRQSFSLKAVDTAIMNGFETVTKLGGYIILFSILSSFVLSIGKISFYLRCFLLSITEITTGISYLGRLSLVLPAYNMVFSMAICACVSFGGLSGFAQTKSVTEDSGLSMKPYLFSKLFIAALSALLYMIFSAF